MINQRRHERDRSEASRPASLDLDLGHQELRIRWSDGLEAVYPTMFLRSRCPCAACRTEREKRTRTLLPVLSGAQSKPAQVVGGHTVGHYALALEWSDGHNTGIYDFRFLRELVCDLPKLSGNASKP